MTWGLIWWVLFIIWALFDGGVRTGNPMAVRYWYGPWILLILIVGILGWHVFPIR